MHPVVRSFARQRQDEFHAHLRSFRCRAPSEEGRDCHPSHLPADWRTLWSARPAAKRPLRERGRFINLNAPYGPTLDWHVANDDLKAVAAGQAESTRDAEVSNIGKRDLDLTLLIPCYRGEEWIEACLDSVVGQTLERPRFELLIVINGPPDRSRDLAEAKLARHPDLIYRIIEVDLPSLSNARNVAIREARGRWLTWLDLDDSLSENYLEELLASARPGIVPLARVVDVSEDGAHRTSVITEQMLEFPPGEHDPAKLWRPLTFAACKLVESDVLASRLFDVSLKSGEDVAFFAPLIQDWGLEFDNTPAHRGATYFRLERAGSMSRRGLDFDFSVSQRLLVMKHLDDAMVDRAGSLAKVMKSMMHSQAMFTQRYLKENPEDFPMVRSAVAASGLRYYPWSLVNVRSNRLAISYNFPPDNDASAVVAAKRLLASGHQWNVVSNDMSSVRKADHELHLNVLEAVSQQRRVKNRPIFGSWGGVEEFCTGGWEAITDIEKIQGKQRHLYSRSMWPASHYLAALYKMRATEPVHWTAEFSDPLLYDIDGVRREGPVVESALSRSFLKALREEGIEASFGDSLFSWAELLPYSLADELIFTNPHQMTYMLSYVRDEKLRDRVRRKAFVRPQPSPPVQWYAIRDEQIVDPRPINLAYFGSFYTTRGLDSVIDALNEIDSQRPGVMRLDIYGKPVGASSCAWRRATENGAVRVLSPVPYLKFLGLATKYSCLVLSDTETARSGQPINPYLPSKLSDYLGSGTKIWGVSEPGSTLSRTHLSYRSRLGDVEAAKRVLMDLQDRTN